MVDQVLHDQAGDVLTAVRQVADLSAKILELKNRLSTDGLSFRSVAERGSDRSGILAIEGSVGADAAIITVSCLLLRVRPGQRSAIGSVLTAVWNCLSSLNDKATLLPLQPQTDGTTFVSVALQVQATPLSTLRASRLTDQLKELHERTIAAQALLPAMETDADLEKLYEKVAEQLEPVLPLAEELRTAITPDVASWTRETMDFLEAVSCVALAERNAAEGACCLAALSLEARRRNTSLGRIRLPHVNTKLALEIARAAPGAVVIPALSLSIGTSAYELGNEMRSLLAKLQSDRHPVVFAGRFEELQAILSGGQGARQDPLSPVVRHEPEFPLGIVARHAARSTARAVGGIPRAVEDQVVAAALESLVGLPPSEQRRFLPAAIGKMVQDSLSSGGPVTSQTVLVERLKGLSETFGGLSNQPRTGRSAEVQQNLARLSDPAFLDLLIEELPGQETALTALYERLRTEALTRPAEQPLRYCAQGTPGTGKSTSARLAARWIGIPYVNIDAASMSDPHTAASQLLGAGRGIVSSYRAGRLEQIARHHTGAVVEISDLDHAPGPVRLALAEMFLQVLDNGEIQSSSGDIIPCANALFVFTVNLPAGEDERVRNTIGFARSVSRSDIAERVSAALKAFTSSAFLSRIGTPIVFDPLDATAMAEIEEGAVRAAVVAAAERLRIHCLEVVLEDRLGARMVAMLGSETTAVGARAAIEHARAMTATAVAKLAKRGWNGEAQALFVSFGDDGELVMTPRE
jgi:hypothetical protein